MGEVCHSYSPTSKKEKGKKYQGLSAQEHMFKTVQIETDGTKKKKIPT